MKKVLFIDRDGTLVKEPLDKQLDSLEKLEYYPEVFQNLAQIYKEMDYALVMVTNQDGLGTPSFPENEFWPVQQKIIQALANEGIFFEEILIDRSFPEDQAATRKPGTDMLLKYTLGNYDLKNSLVIGDRSTDVELAKNLGCGSIYLNTDTHSNATLSTSSWKDIYTFLKQQPRIAQVNRKTNETNILVQLNLDGNGKSNVTTGIGFLDHMLDQISIHGNIDLTVITSGDLEVDEHHTIEDVAIALGQCMTQALKTKKGIERYGFVLPMDDCLAQVAVDFGGRPWLVWEAVFKREKIGEMPTEMFMHFFKSFSDHAKCNLNIKAEGNNEHHKIEAIFKAFSKSIKMAISKTNIQTIPSTKGTL